MAINSIHDELAALSQSNPAGYILTQSFAHLNLNRLLSSANLLKGKIIPAGNGQLSASLRDLVWVGSPSLSLQQSTSAAFPDREVDITISSGFDVIIDIFISGDPKKIISEVVMSIQNVRTHLRAENNVLIFEGADFDSRRNITRDPSAEVLLNAEGIDPIEAARIEGHIGYGVVSQAITAALAQRSEIPLASIFPAINFGTAIKLAILTGGEALGIIPTEAVTIVSSAHCECAEGVDFPIGDTTITKTEPSNVEPNTEIGQVTIGGPLPDNKDPLRDFGQRHRGKSGIAGLYIPKSFAQDLTVDVMPAIKIVASDRGTIGYRAEATVGFNNFKVDFDLAGGGILLDFDLDVSVSAYCDFELFKGLRIPIGWAIVMPSNGSQAHIQIGFYPSVDNSGTVRLKSTLKKVDMGSYVAVVIGIGTALEILGVTAWIGFLIDVVLAGILSHKLPIELKKQISKYLANKEWKLIEGLPLVDPTLGWFPSAPFDVTSSSLLASFEIEG